MTILISALLVIFSKKDEQSKREHFIKYISALFFGLIHGLGYSNYLKAKKREFVLIISGAVIGIASILIIERLLL